MPIQGRLVASTALALRQAPGDGLGPALLADWLIDKDVKAGWFIDLFRDLEATATHFDSAVWLFHAVREKQLTKHVRSALGLLRQHLRG